MQEIWDLYDKNRELTGLTVSRGDRIPDGMYHGVVDIFVIDEDNKVLLVRRSFDKEVYPGLWESGAGGSVKSGESFYEAARRELFEETGIRSRDLNVIGTDISKISIYTEYLVRVKKNIIIKLSNESLEYKWVTLEEFLDILSNDESFMPSKRNRLEKKIDYLKELIKKIK